MTAEAATPAAPSRVLARCRSAGRTYGSGATAVVAVSAVSCIVGAGDRVVITGPSGSGKSTLLHLLAGLDIPTEGSVDWPALGDRDSLRPLEVAVIFQGPSLLAPLDVGENVALPLLLAGVDEESARTAARAALESLELGALAAKLPEELSGGQAQRVAVARVLATSPRLLLADEPTGQLDHATGEHMLDILEAAVSGLGAAMVITTHDRRIAERYPRRWPMADGRLGAAEDRGC